MTSFKSSNAFSGQSSGEGERCPDCGGAVSERPAHPYPVIEQVLFGVSFVAFLGLFDRMKSWPAVLWGWSAVQGILGLFLIRGRIRSRKRVLRCIRCGVELR